jgi:hypothetical protein
LRFAPESRLYVSDAVLGRSGKKLKQFGWIHEMACPKPNVLYVAQLLNWRVQKLLLG